MQDPLSRPIRAGQIGAAARAEAVVASGAECAALAVLFGLPAIASLRGDFTLKREAGGVIAAELRLQAQVSQVCVISLDAFEATIDERARLRFVPAAALGEAAELAELDDASLEAPDDLPYGNDRIDLGVVLAEQLALSLDPYPRKPGVAFSEAAVADAHPFAALAARLKPRD